MGIFGSKYEGMQEFATMRRVLGNADASPTVELSSATKDGIVDERAGSHDNGAAPLSSVPSPLAVRPAATAPDKCASVVSSGSSWEGSLKLDGSARVDGGLTGTIEARETVHISENAQVEAQVRAAFVVIAGSFSGQVECERLELLPTSRIRGDLSTKSLMIHEGAFIDGQIHMISEPRPGEAGGGAPTKKSSLPAARDIEVDSSKATPHVVSQVSN